MTLKRPPQIRSFWRAVLAGVVAHPLIIVALSMVYWALRPFVWAAIYMEPYQPLPGPYSPNSGEWLFAQGISFGASVVAGIAAAYWSPQKSKLPITILVTLSFVALFFAQFPFDTSAIRNAVYALHTPLGLVVGASLLKRWQAKTDVKSGACYDIQS